MNKEIESRPKVRIALFFDRECCQLILISILLLGMSTQRKRLPKSPITCNDIQTVGTCIHWIKKSKENKPNEEKVQYSNISVKH